MPIYENKIRSAERVKGMILGALAVHDDEYDWGWDMEALARLFEKYNVPKDTIEGACDELLDEGLITVKFTIS